MNTVARIVSALLFLIPTLIFPSSSLLYAQQNPVDKMDSATKDYLKYLIDGRGKRPPAPAGAILNAKVLSDDHTEVGDLQTEIEYYKRTYGSPNGWALENRQKAYSEVQNLSESSLLKEQGILSPPTQWTLRGPIGMEHRCTPGMFWSGRISCIDYSPTRGIYLGAAKGGLWSPVLIVYVPITDHLPTLASGGIGINPSNPDVIYYGTGDYGTQAGGGGTGTYKTTNAGASWSLMPLAPTPTVTSRVLVAPWNNNTVFVAGDAGIFKTTDAGGVWTQTAWWNASDLSTNSTGSVMLAGRAWSGVYRSTDQGTTWLPLTSGLATDYVGNIKVAIGQHESSVAYVVIARPWVKGDIYRDGQVRGVYRTDDVGAATVAWTEITPISISTYPYMYGQGWYHNALAIDPQNTSNVFIGGGAILRSTNAGLNWTPLSTVPHADTKVLFFPPAGGILYAGGDGGIFTSTDLGDSWSTVLNRLLPTTMFYNIDVGKSNDDVVFGSSQDNATEGTAPGFRSTWMVSNIADGIDAGVDWSNPTTVFATTQYGDVFRSPTLGSECPQWPFLNSALMKTEWSAYIYQDPGDPNWIYYNGGKNIYYSTNKGTSWPGTLNASTLLSGTVKNIAANSNGAYVYGITDAIAERLVRFEFGGIIPIPFWNYLNVSTGLPSAIPVKVVTSLSDPGRVYALFNNSPSQRIYRSTDFGFNWTNITGNFTSGIPLHDLVEHPTNHDVLCVGTDLGVFKSTNGGTKWLWWNNGMPNAVIVNDLEYAYSPSGDYLVAGTFGRSTYERDINAPAYITGLVGGVRGPNSFTLVDGEIFAPLDSGRVAKSTDDGSSWTLLSVPTPVKLSDFHLIDSLTYIVIGQFGTIFRTTNAGQQWGQLPSPTQHELRRFAWPTPSHGFAVGDGGVVLKSIDGGTDWFDASPGLSASFFDIFFTDPMNGFIAGTLNGPTQLRLLLRTTDGGQTWNQQAGISGAGSFFDIFFVDALNGYCTSGNGQLLSTTDGGENWTSIQTPSNASLLGSFFTDPRHGWVCGTGGVLMKTTDGGSSWETEDTGVNDTLFALTSSGNNLVAGGSGGMISRGIEQPVSLGYAVASGWNMVSVPLGLSDFSVGSVFPSSTSAAFSFDGRYAQQTTLQNGVGYWVKFSAPQIVKMTGFMRDREFIDVKRGWNMIGSTSSSIPVNGVTQQPEGIVLSKIFGYADGYFPATSIEPAHSYWVKVSQDGQLFLNADAFHLTDSGSVGLHAASNRSKNILDGLNRLTIRDRAGSEQTLYYSLKAEDASQISSYTMPPPPPSGSFDARFVTGSMMECANATSTREIRIVVKSTSYPVTIQWSVREPGRVGSLIIDGGSTSLNGEGTLQVNDSGSVVGLSLPPVSVNEIPKEYALDQNFPNPFNPKTRIQYALPGRSFVRLVIVNVLGQELASLVDGIEEAGYQTHDWDASKFASGIYLCRLEATSLENPKLGFTTVRKMLLLK